MTFLLAITSARKVSESVALSTRTDLFIFHPNRVVLRLDPTFLLKINSPYHRALELGPMAYLISVPALPILWSRLGTLLMSGEPFASTFEGPHL